jgi:Mg2+/Co2+ transporter CorB
MDGVSLSSQLALLAILFIAAAFFCLAETAVLVANRQRLHVAAERGSHRAKLALSLIDRLDRVLAVITLFNTLINSAAAVMAGSVAIKMMGDSKWALEGATVAVTFCLLVFSEITPKVVGAAYADWLMPRISLLLDFSLRVSAPVLAFVNLFVDGLLRLARLRGQADPTSTRLTPDELRALVKESAVFIPEQHRAILLNLFDLEHVTVDDVMAPRGEIEAIDVEAPIEEIRAQLGTSFHTRVPVFQGDPGNIIGILHQRRLLSSALAGEFDRETLRQELAAPYFVPTGTGIYAQLQFFRDNRQRMGLVVDEYGELLGLVTLEDIVEEIVGKFTTGMPGSTAESSWDEQGTAIVDGAHSLREINRALDLALPLDGPKTLNGLITEHLQDIPEVGVGLRIGEVAMEILQTENRRVKTVKLYRPRAEKSLSS